MFVHTFPLCLKTLWVVFAALCSAFEPVHLHQVGLSDAQSGRVPARAWCVHRTRTRSSRKLLFSLSLPALLLALLTAIVSPSSTALPCERGTGEVHFALFDNVITTIMMIVLMMIIHMVKIKGGESERAGSGLGGGDVCSVISGLRRQKRRRTRV